MLYCLNAAPYNKPDTKEVHLIGDAVSIFTAYCYMYKYRPDRISSKADFLKKDMIYVTIFECGSQNQMDPDLGCNNDVLHYMDKSHPLHSSNL